ncbi:MAG: hypothetical protein CM1200mP20_11870 [Pseudomonadota bacterium]|nr:MAG: hypothetical protein CM1200mP20_11870 [Pseudomonadota bacterium]
MYLVLPTAGPASRKCDDQGIVECVCGQVSGCSGSLQSGSRYQGRTWSLALGKNPGRKEGRSIAAAVENAGSRRSVLDSWLEAQKTDLTVRVDQTGSGTSYGTQEHRRLDFPTDYRYRFVMLQRSSVGS